MMRLTSLYKGILSLLCRNSSEWREERKATGTEFISKPTFKIPMREEGIMAETLDGCNKCRKWKELLSKPGV